MLSKYCDPSVDQNGGLKYALWREKHDVCIALFEDERSRWVTCAMLHPQDDEVVNELMYQNLKATSQEIRNYLMGNLPESIEPIVKRLIVDGKIDDGLTDEFIRQLIDRLLSRPQSSVLYDILRILFNKFTVNDQEYSLRFCVRSIQRTDAEMLKLGLKYLEDPSSSFESEYRNSLIRMCGNCRENWRMVGLLYSYRIVRQTAYLGYWVCREREEEVKRWFFCHLILKCWGLPKDVIRCVKVYTTWCVYDFTNPSLLEDMDAPRHVNDHERFLVSARLQNFFD
jgi:hypothetical protein